MRKTRLPPLGALRAFHAVAGCRSFKHAAEALGVSATAVSHQIKLLESVLECRVCERSAQGVSLTETGELLYAGTQRALVRVQSEEPYLEKPAQGNLSGLFAVGRIIIGDPLNSRYPKPFSHPLNG